MFNQENSTYTTINPFNYGFSTDDFLLLCDLKPKRGTI